MMSTSWTHKAISAAVAAVAVGLLLQWAWALLRPLVPVIAIIGGVILIGRLIWQRRQNW